LDRRLRVRIEHDAIRHPLGLIAWELAGQPAGLIETNET
jgi:hypothetical protein